MSGLPVAASLTENQSVVALRVMDVIELKQVDWCF